MKGAPSVAPSGQNWWSPGRFALLLAVMIFIPFREVLQGAQTFAVRDFGLFGYPVAAYFRDSFWRGEWPLWNPLSCCGTPFLAQLNTLTLYPPSLIYLLLPLTWSLPFFCLLHLFLGGLGMYLLAARWSGSRLGGAVAGTLFAFNGLSLNFLMWPSHIATFALMPWVIWLAREAWECGGRRIILAALAAAFQVLAGGPETILFTWLFLFVLAALAMQKAALPRLILARRFFAVGCLALCLAAAQWLPFLDLSLHSNRGTQFGNAAWCMPPCGWANFLVPLFQTSPWQQILQQEHQHWTSSYYAGIGAVFLAVMALGRCRSWRVWLPGVMLGLSLVLALGDRGFLLTPLQHLFPFLGLFRYPVKFVLVAIFALPLLAATAIGHYENWKPLPPRWWRPDLACGFILLVLVGLILWFARQSPAGGLSWTKVAANGLERAGFLILIIALLFFLVIRPAARGWTGLALLAVCWLDVLTHMPWQNPTAHPSIYQPGLERILKPGPVVAGQSRVMMSPYSARQMYYNSTAALTTNYLLDRSVFLADCNLLDGVPKVDGFFSLYLRHIDKVLSLFDTNSEARLAGLEDVMAVSQTIAPGKVFDWVPRPSYIPWITAGQAPVFASEQSTLQALADPGIDFHKSIYLPLEAQSSVTAQRQEAARVVAKQFGSAKIVLEVETPGPAMISLSQAWYHNWKASVDGHPVPLWRANEAFQAVEVPAGRHQLTLAYQDLAFRWGAFLSVLGLIVCGLCWSWFGPTKPCGPSTPSIPSGEPWFGAARSVF
ncbi:MAG: YfhO family protein [Verrucomicrobiota bacterium]